MKLIDSINKIRLHRGLTDEGIADALNVTKATVHRWRKGITKHTSPITARKIADLLNCDFDEENGETIFVDKKEFTVIDLANAPPELSDSEKALIVLKKHAKALGYEPTPEGLNKYLKECEGQYRTLNQIKEILAKKEEPEKIPIFNK